MRIVNEELLTLGEYRFYNIWVEDAGDLSVIRIDNQHSVSRYTDGSDEIDPPKELWGIPYFYEDDVSLRRDLQTFLPQEIAEHVFYSVYRQFGYDIMRGAINQPFDNPIFFKFGKYWLDDPFKDVTLRDEVDPIAYYGFEIIQNVIVTLVTGRSF